MTKPNTQYAINAIHTKSGGGLVYLLRVLPFIVQKANTPIDVYVDSAQAIKFKNIPNINIISVKPPKNFLLMHLWEQTIFALQLRFAGYKAVLCNANYVPLLAKNPLPIIHSNASVIDYDSRFTYQAYWKTLKLLTKATVARCKLGFSVASHVLPMYAKGAQVAKMHIAYPAADIDTLNTVERDASTIIAVGDIYVQKDYEVLLKAFKRVLDKNPSMRLMIVGRELDKKIAQKLKDYVAEHRLQDNVKFLGFISHSQLFPLLERATIYLNTSLVECFNMPVLEALACGAPTVMFDHDFQKEVAGDAAQYVHFSKDPEKREEYMAKAVCDLLENEERRKVLGERGLERATQFSWEKTAEVIWNNLKRS